MKRKLLLFIILLGFTIQFCQAQYQKGAKFGLIELGFSGGSNNVENVAQTIKATSARNYVMLNYRRGVFRKDNFATGWILGYGLETYKYTNSKYPGSSLLTHNVSAGYFVDKFIPISNSLVGYGGLLGKAGTSFETRDSSSKYNNKIYFLDASVNLGLRYHFNPKWFVNAETSLINISYRDYLSKSDFGQSYSYSNATRFEIRSLFNSGYIFLSIGKSF